MRRDLQHARDRGARRAETEHADLRAREPEAGALRRDLGRRERRDGGAVLVVVQHGHLERFDQAPLDLEADRRLDVLELDRAEALRDAQHGVDDRAGIARIEHDREGRDPDELVEECRLAFHHRQRGHRSHVAEPEDARAVRDDRDRLAADRVAVRLLGMRHQRAHHLGHARRVDAAQVVDAPDGVRRAHLELAVDVELVDVVDHVEEVHLVERAHDGERLLERGSVLHEHVEIADDVVGAAPYRADVADVRARRADRGRKAAEDARAVGVPAAERAEERIGHARGRA